MRSDYDEEEFDSTAQYAESTEGPTDDILSQFGFTASDHGSDSSEPEDPDNSAEAGSTAHFQEAGSAGHFQIKVENSDTSWTASGDFDTIQTFKQERNSDESDN